MTTNKYLPGVPTLAVVLVFVVALIAISTSFVLIYFFPIVGSITVATMLFYNVFLDSSPFNGRGKPITSLRQWSGLSALTSYFNSKLLQEAPLKSRQYIFAMHPHGIVCGGAWLHFIADTAGFAASNKLDIAVATIRLTFYIPFWSSFMLAVGTIDASFKSLKAALSRKRSVAIIVGGATEALDAHPNTNNITLYKRMGFIKLAIVTGTPIVPVYVFGENNLWNQVKNPKGSLLRRVQDFMLTRLKFSLPLLYGTGIFNCPIGVLPYPTPILTVTGKPLAVVRNAHPSREEIQKLHATYVKALQEIFNKHAEDFYKTKDVKLNIIA